MEARVLDRPRSIVAATTLAFVALVAIALALVLVSPAAAGGPGKWTDISGPVGSLLVQPDAVRGAGGVLHVVWATSGASDDLFYRPISLAGAAGTRQVLASSWPSVNNPAIVYSGSGGTDEVVVFSGGQSPGLAQSGLFAWDSVDNGAAFAPLASVISGPGGLAYQSPMAAVVTPGSSDVFQAWFNSAVVVHRGMFPGGDHDVNDAGPDGWCPAFGYDAVASRLYVVWSSNATGAGGVRYRLIDQATGDAVGPSVGLANSTTAYSGAQEFSLKNTRTPVAGLAGQSVVLVAYPTGYPTSTTMRVWRLTPGGQSNIVLAKGGSEKNAAAAAADTDGRAWVVWTDTSGTRRHVYARRSNVGATAWGQTVSLLGPSGTETLWQLAVSAQSDRLDVLGQFTRGADNVVYHTQMLAGLTVTTSPTKTKLGKTVTVTVTVKDAGVAVAGAKVTIGKKNATTAASGVAKLKAKATKAGKLVVSVKKSGYASAAATIKVTR